ncbi:transposase family protein [Streptomyces sp. NPDC048106]|uniref:transposase family protein n=1 Tax=Streptomyces sp. NPDC048106 TaxID=3155750 RepID=UPI0034524CED
MDWEAARDDALGTADHRHGLHVVALTDERGRMTWISAARPGPTHNITAARRDHILAHLRATGLGALADLGFIGLDDNADAPVVITGFKATRARKLTPVEKDADHALTTGRASVGHGFAHLKNWRIPTQLRTGPPAPLTSCAPSSVGEP